RGENVTCAAAACPPAGACCKNDGSCVDVTSGACTVAAGVWHAGVACAGTACTGACCLTDGTCTGSQTRNQCAGLGGTYGGDAVTCANANCPHAGACCKADGTCSQITAAACAAATGAFGGADTLCANAVCTGAC